MGQASVDLYNAYDSVEQKMKANRTYIEVKQDAEKIKKDLKNNLEKNKNSVTTTVEKLKEQKKRYQRQVKTQMDQMLSMVQFNQGSGSSTMRYIKTKFIQAAITIGPKISEMLLKESIKSLGCSQQQAFTATTVYIKVKSTDLQNLLKRDPTEDTAAVAYEKTPPVLGVTPYSMNREMWDRLQNLNVPSQYNGGSGQKLFDITYVQQDNNSITGDFYKIDLVNKPTGNTVGSFLNDYYRAINLVDTNNLFAQLMDQVSGAVSFDAKLGYGELLETNKFILLLQRILGLCFDNRREIDVSGNAKVAELDGVDESFFEFTDIDLRYLDDLISNIQNGVVEFEDCENVKFPVDTTAVMDSLLKFNQLTKTEDIEKQAMSLTDVLVDNDKWKLPNSFDVNLSVDLSFLTNLPKAIMMALLSPKIVLPLLIMSKAISQNIADSIESLLDFMRAFKKYVINVMSKIGGLFVETLFDIIKKDIKTLIGAIISDIAREKIFKKYAIILKLVELILIIARFVEDWRRCKSVVDEILALLNLIGSSIGPGGSGAIPAPLLAASELLDGFSNTRAAINVIEELQKIGIPTGPMPDGSPNLYLQAKVAEIKGVERERIENGKVQVFVKPLTVINGMVTQPSGSIYGKSY